MSWHKQIEIRYPFTAEIISVDEGIVDLLTLLWDQGVETGYSCQGDPGLFAYVAYKRTNHPTMWRVIHSMALPYVRWCRYDTLKWREGGPMWSVHWYWDWTIITQVESVLKNG